MKLHPAYLRPALLTDWASSGWFTVQAHRDFVVPCGDVLAAIYADNTRTLREATPEASLFTQS